MKMILSGAASSDADRGGTLIGFALLDHFLELAAIQLALDAAYPVDEQLAIEMIYLVLEGHREQLLGLDLDFLLFGRPRPDQHLGGTFHFRGIVDHRKASFLPDKPAFGLHDSRVNELEQMFARFLLGGVEHDDAL